MKSVQLNIVLQLLSVCLGSLKVRTLSASNTATIMDVNPTRTPYSFLEVWSETFWKRFVRESREGERCREQRTRRWWQQFSSFRSSDWLLSPFPSCTVEKCDNTAGLAGYTVLEFSAHIHLFTTLNVLTVLAAAVGYWRQIFNFSNEIREAHHCVTTRDWFKSVSGVVSQHPSADQ
jgi:hypothetical protein